MKKPFLEAPLSWTRCVRMSQQPWEYACAVQRFSGTHAGASKVLVGVALALLVAAVALVV